MNSMLRKYFQASCTLVSVAACSSFVAAALPSVQPDALLSIDLNRAAVVERVLSAWSSELPAMQRDDFKAKLMALRADQLMAANLSGSFEGVLEVLVSTEAAERVLVQRGSEFVAIEDARVNRAKAVGELDKDLVYTPIVPCNLMDTRPGITPTPPVGAPALAAGYAVRVVQVSGNCGIPLGALGVAALYTIENIPSSGGVVFAADAGGTGGAVVSWSAPSQYATGSGITPLSTAGAMQLQSAGTTHIKVDITGYFMPPYRQGNGLRVFQTSGTYTNAPNVVNGSWDNQVAGYGATVSGGGLNGLNCFNVPTNNATRNCANYAAGNFSTVSGGYANRASSQSSVVGGGSENTASGVASAVLGGGRNLANADLSVVAGGYNNTANGLRGTVGGGILNNAGGENSTVGGGYFNVATGTASTIPGGDANEASAQLSFAAGQRAKARHTNSFVWGGNPNADTFSTMASEFVVWAPGRIAMYATSGGCILTAGASGWACTSDVAAKHRIESLSPSKILSQVAALPIKAWTYLGDTSNSRNVGPMAQDFFKSFGLGDSDKHISAMNMGGVALAAIQGLNQKLAQTVKSKDAELAQLKSELAAIKKKLGM